MQPSLSSLKTWDQMIRELAAPVTTSTKETTRIHNDPTTEFRTALDQIERIALLRLKDLLP